MTLHFCEGRERKGFSMTFSFASLVWLVLLIAFAVVEGMTVALVSVWFAIGAAAALLVSVFTSSWLVQFAVFLIVSAVMLVLLRKYAKSRMMPAEAPTNAALNVGKTAEVIAAVTPEVPGRVRLDGVDWQARSDAALAAGQLCRVLQVEGAALVVAPDETAKPV